MVADDPILGGTDPQADARTVLPITPELVERLLHER